MWSKQMIDSGLSNQKKPSVDERGQNRLSLKLVTTKLVVAEVLLGEGNRRSESSNPSWFWGCWITKAFIRDIISGCSKTFIRGVISH
jgi:hypothetical protein